MSDNGGAGSILRLSGPVVGDEPLLGFDRAQGKSPSPELARVGSVMAPSWVVGHEGGASGAWSPGN